jgi:hypothetical protein
MLIQHCNYFNIHLGVGGKHDDLMAHFGQVAPNDVGPVLAVQPRQRGIDDDRQLATTGLGQRP